MPTTRALSSFAEWYRSGRLAGFVTAHRQQADVVSILEATQPPGDMSDPPTSDLVLVQVTCDWLAQTSDLGAGRFSGASGRDTLFLVSPGVATDIRVHCPHSIRTFAFPSTRYREVLTEARKLQAPFDFGHLHAHGFQSQAIVAVAERLWCEAESGAPHGRLAAQGLSLQILAELVALTGRSRVHSPHGGLSGWAVRRCREYLDAHLGEDVSVDELATLAGLSPFHFARAFHRSFGLPPYRYLRRLRCQRARDLLRNPNTSIIDVALQVGYGSPQAFARMFRAEMGMSPKEWRRVLQS